MTKFANHFNVIAHTFFQSLRFQGFSLFFEQSHLLHQIILYLANRDFLRFFAGQKQVGRIYFVLIEVGLSHPCDTIDFFYRINFVIPEVDAQHVIRVGEKDIYRISLDAKITTSRRDIVARIERVYQAFEQNVHCNALSHSQKNYIFVECRGISHTIDATHR